MASPLMDWQSVAWWTNMALWTGLTCLFYWLAGYFFRWCKGSPLTIPIFTATLLLITVLLASGTSHTRYASGTSILLFLMAPALVVLAVPMRQQMRRMREIWWPLMVALGAGCMVAIVSAVLIAWLLRASDAMLLSFIPKSATTPIAISVIEPLGGVPAITALLVCATGVAGAMLARPLMRWMRIDDDVVRGVAVGVAAHAIGTAREMQDNPGAGAYAALAMCLNGILTAAVTPLIVSLAAVVNRF